MRKAGFTVISLGEKALKVNGNEASQMRGFRYGDYFSTRCTSETAVYRDITS